MSENLSNWRPRQKESRWNILKREVLHRNPWYTYVCDKGIRDDGQPFEYYYLSIPFAVGVLALTENNELVLVKQYRYLTSKDSLEVPGGTGGFDETPEEIARRELLEETGYSAEQFKRIATFDVSNGMTNDVAHLFLARHAFKQQEPQPEASERGMCVELLPVKDVYDMAEAGTIQDSFTLAALLLARKELHP